MKKSIAIFLFSLIAYCANAQQIILAKEIRYTPKDSLKFMTITNDSFYLYMDPVSGKLRRTVLTTPGSATRVDSVTFNSSAMVDTVKYWINGTSYVAGLIDVKNGLISGGVVSWNSGLTFDVSPAVYRIANQRYTMAAMQITLDAADPSDPRLDVIGLDAAGVIKVTGTPAASPAKPQVNIQSEIELTNVLINAGATSPGGVSQTIVYDENTGPTAEWLAASNLGAGTATLNSTNNPFNGSINILLSSDADGSLTMTAASPVNIADYSLLKLYIRTDAGAIDPDYDIGVSPGLTNSYGVASLNLQNYGFLPTATGSYQMITIPLADFGYSQSTFDQLYFKFAAAGVSWHIDYVQLQGGISTPGGSPYITNIYREPGTTNVMKVVNGVSSLAFTDNNEMDIFLAIGQSNMTGQGTDTAASPNPSPNTVFQYWNGSFQQVTNEVGAGVKSSLLPSFGITYNNITGKKICIVQTAVSGTGMMEASNAASGAAANLNWGQGGVLYDSSVNRLDSAINAIALAGYIPKLKGVFMYQGETDALAKNSGYITAQMYKDTLTTMISRYRNHYYSNLPFYAIQIGNRTGSPITGFDSIRYVTKQVIDSNALNNKIVCWDAAEYVDSLYTVDAIHLNTAALNRVGRTAAINITTYQSNNFQNDGIGDLTFKRGNVRIINSLFAPNIIGGKSSTSNLTLKTTTGTAGSQYFRILQGNNGDKQSVYIPYTTSGAQVWDFNFGGNRGVIKITSGTDDYTGFRFDRTSVGTFVMLVGSGTTSTGVLDVNGNDFVIGQYVGNIRLGGSSSGSIGYTGLLINTNARSVSIGSSSVPASTSQFDVSSPGGNTGTRPYTLLTTAQRTAIVSPATGLKVYDTDFNAEMVFNGTVWTGYRFNGTKFQGYDGSTWVDLN